MQHDDVPNTTGTASPRITRPAEGAQLEEEFQLQFASSSSGNDTYRVILRQGSAEGTEVASDLRGGSSVTWSLKRPAHLLAGFYGACPSNPASSRPSSRLTRPSLHKQTWSCSAFKMTEAQ